MKSYFRQPFAFVLILQVCKQKYLNIWSLPGTPIIDGCLLPPPCFHLASHMTSISAFQPWYVWYLKPAVKLCVNRSHCYKVSAATVWLCETISVGPRDSCWAITQLEQTVIVLYQLAQSDQNVEVKLLLHAAVCIKGANNLHLHTAACRLFLWESGFPNLLTKWVRLSVLSVVSQVRPKFLILTSGSGLRD